MDVLTVALIFIGGNMTRTVLRNTIRKKIGESTAAYFEDSDLDQWIEDAQLDIVWKAKCKRQRSLATTVASTVRYSLSTLVSDLLRIFKVRVYDSSTTDWTKVKFATQEFLDERFPGWMTANAGPPEYYVYDVELNEFILYPKADTDQVGTNYLEIYNSIKPTAIANDSASPDLPTMLHPAVIDYVVATGLAARGYEDIANNNWQQYYGKVKSYMTEREVEEDEEIIMRPMR